VCLIPPSPAPPKRFDKQLIAMADRRFSAHLERLKAATKKGE
jgi:hypothetical protein